MTALPPSLHPQDSHRLNREATTLSVAVAVILIGMKAFALGATGSVSILASLADSALDLAGSLGAFLAVRWAAAPPDAEHRHGHGKAEALSALVQSGLVFASAIFIGWEAIGRVIDPRPVTGGYWGVTVILIAMGLSAWLVWRQTRTIRATGSLAVSGDRAHYLADLGANAVVLVGLISGAFLGAPALDAAAGLIVAVWLFWGAAGILKSAADQLLDRDIGDAGRARIVQAVLSDSRITGVHRLRTRVSGAVTAMQMHVDLDPTLTLQAAHDIVAQAEARLLAVFPGADILIHLDPRGQAGKVAPSAPSDDTAPSPVVRGPWT